MIVRAAARAVPAKIRSPARTTALPARGGGGAVTDTGLLFWVLLLRWCYCGFGASCAYGGPGPGPPYVHVCRYFAAIAPTMPCAFSARVASSGAEPACSAEACWPSSETM
ncbi:hypothetical protein GCM10009795_000320 [Nocardioides hankookensis]